MTEITAVRSRAHNPNFCGFPERRKPQRGIHLVVKPRTRQRASRRSAFKRLRKLPPHAFAHLIQSKIQFPKVARKTATSIILLTVLLAGVITPTGLCAVMCERHFRTESHVHCSQPSDAMPGMAHHHSGMNHPSVEAVSSLSLSQSCQTNCVAAERLAISRKVLSQMTVVQTGVVVLDNTSKLLVPDLATARILDNGPPYPPSVGAASFSVLRI